MQGTFIHCLWVYAKLTFFKATPEQVPWNWACVVKAFILYVALNLFLLDSKEAIVTVIFKVMLELGLLAIFLYLGLKAGNKLERFNKTFSALIGVAVIISLISVPLFAIISPDFYATQAISPAVVYLTLFLLLWNLSLISFILKRSLEVSTLMAVFLTFNYFLSYEIILITLFGAEA